MFQLTQNWLNAYFSGKTLPVLPTIHLEGSEFRQRVWQLLRNIPTGETTTYGDLANKLAEQSNQVVSAQAVGGAVGHNPISILVPGHRVIGKTGALTGYAGGLERKIALLELEQRSK